MDKLIVAVVKDEASAYELLSSLEALDGAGEIEIFGSRVVEKNQEGRLVEKKQGDLSGLGTLVGVAVGSLLGLMAGPVGFAVGAVAGGAAAFAGETAYSGVTGEFVVQVSQSMPPGSFAVVMEAWEDWTYPVDEVARRLGARVVRQPIGDVVKAQMKAEEDAGSAELARLENEVARAQDDSRSKLEAELARARQQHAERRDRREARQKEVQSEWAARLASIHQKAKASSSEAQRRHQAHLEEVSVFAAGQEPPTKTLRV
jgi:uncharacterized membrane protein